VSEICVGERRVEINRPGYGPLCGKEGQGSVSDTGVFDAYVYWLERAKKCVRNWCRRAPGRDKQTRVRPPLNKQGQGSVSDTGVFDAYVYWLERAKKCVRDLSRVAQGRDKLTKVRPPLKQKGREGESVRYGSSLCAACVYWLQRAKKRVRNCNRAVPGRDRLTRLRPPLWQGRAGECIRYGCVRCVRLLVTARQ